MSDYEFRCPECKKVTTTHSSGEVPLNDERVECIACGRISIVTDSLTNLFVNITSTKITPSKLKVLEKQK